MRYINSPLRRGGYLLIILPKKKLMLNLKEQLVIV